MTRVTWDQTGQRFYETGVDQGVLYIPNSQGVYSIGVAWNGLVSVTEAPSGAESSPQYADNIKYLNLRGAEDFGATIEAYTYPDLFAQCDGSATPTPGLVVAQQSRKSFGLAYRTKIGNDISGQDLGYKIHLIYGATASPSERAYTTINDSPEAITFSWELTTDAVPVTGYKPTSLLVIDSTKVSAAGLTALTNAIYGTVGADPRLPLPDEVLGMFAGSITTVTTIAPTYNNTTDLIAIPAVTGITYYINDAPVTGNVAITQTTVVTARPNAGYAFSATSDNDWTIVFS